MKVLWLTREDPLPADRGDLIYSAGLIKSLASHRATVTILTYSAKSYAVPDKTISVIGVPHATKPRLFSLATKLPADAYRLKSRAYAVALHKALRAFEPDVVVIDYFAMGWVVDVLNRHQSKEGGKRPVIFYAAHHFEQHVRPFVAREYRGSPFIKAVLPYDASKAAALERRVVAAATHITTITPQDTAFFEEMWTGKRVTTLLPGYDGPKVLSRTIDQSTPRRVILVGAFDWIAKRQNLKEFVIAANELFRKRAIELQIVGRAGSDYIKEIQDIFPGTKFTGKVESVYPFLADARIGLMPDVLGGGFKLKYLDYMFNRVPVATIRSQAIGLPVSIDDDLISSDDIADLALKVANSIDDYDRLNRLQETCFEQAIGQFDWTDRGRILMRAFENELALRDAE